jgi:hypothetical protein
LTADRGLARLSFFGEVPAVISPGFGSFAAGVNKDGSMIRYQLSYQSSGAVQAAHVHVGRPGVNGGIAAPACPSAPGMVEGMLMAENIVGSREQGVAPGEPGKLIAALVEGVACVNVQTARYPDGELGGPIATPPGFQARWQDPAEEEDDKDADEDSDVDVDDEDEDEDDDFDDDDDEEDAEVEYRNARPRR